MDEYRGFEFTTDKGIECIIVQDKENENYIIVNMDDYNIMARSSYSNIKESIETIKNNY